MFKYFIAKKLYMKKKSYMSTKIEKKKCKIGFGLFAKEKIKKGEIVIDFSTGPGKYMSTKESDDTFFNKGVDYGLQIDDDLFFVPNNAKEIESADFLNHSCNPTLGIKGNMQMVALRDIEKGEEITFDYATAETSKYSMKCHCGSKDCRKIITGDDWKIKDLQKKYKNFFSDYIKREFSGKNNF